jgi:hypothetical protein
VPAIAVPDQAFGLDAGERLPDVFGLATVHGHMRFILGASLRDGDPRPGLGDNGGAARLAVGNDARSVPCLGVGQHLDAIGLDIIVSFGERCGHILAVSRGLAHHSHATALIASIPHDSPATILT